MSTITPPASPTRLRKEGRRSLCLPNCQGFRNISSNSVHWVTGEYIQRLLMSSTDFPKVLNSAEIPVMAKRCDSLEFAKCRLSQLFNLFFKMPDDPLDLAVVKSQFSEVLLLFFVHSNECFSQSHFEEVSNAISSVLKYADKFSAQVGTTFYSCADSHSCLLHMHLELIYYVMTFCHWVSKTPQSKELKLNFPSDQSIQKNVTLTPFDELVFYTLTDVLQITGDMFDKVCACLSEFRIVLLHFAAASSTLTELFFEWLKQRSSPAQLADFCSYFTSTALPALSSFGTTFSTVSFQPFLVKMLQLLLSNCFSTTSNQAACISTSLNAVGKILELLSGIDDASLRSIWDFFTLNLNNFHLPHFLRDLLICPDSSNGDLVDFFRSGEKAMEVGATDMAYPLVSFVELFLHTFFLRLPNDSDKKRVWRKLKGGLYKRFYEASLRKLNDDGWVNAVFMLIASAVAASGHSSEDILLVGEILQRVAFADLSETGQLVVMSGLFLLLKLNSSWTEEFHPTKCARTYFLETLTKPSLSRALVIQYFRCVDMYLGDAKGHSLLDSCSVDLLNLPGFGKALLNETRKADIDQDFLQKLMDVIGSILLSVRQTVLAAGDSQGSNDDHQPPEEIHNLLSRLVLSVWSSLYPAIAAFEQCLSTSVDVDNFISLLRGFLLLSLDTAHLSLTPNATVMIRPHDIVSKYAIGANTRLGIMFLADCFSNNRIAGLLQSSEVVTQSQCLEYFARLSYRLLVEIDSLKTTTNMLNLEASCYYRFEDCVYRIAKLTMPANRRQDSTLTVASLIDTMTNFLYVIGRSSDVSDVPQIVDVFLSIPEEAFKMGYDSAKASLVKTVFRLAGSLFSFCAPLLYAPFRPDCFLSKAVTLYLYRIVNTRKTVPPSYVISTLHKWVLPGILTGVGRLLQQLSQSNDANLRRYVMDCVVESLNRGSNRPVYTSQNIEVHPLVTSGIIFSRVNSQTEKSLSKDPIAAFEEADDVSCLRKMVIEKLASDCLDSSSPNWSMATDLLECHLTRGNWQQNSMFAFSLEATVTLILPRLLDHCCAYEERRVGVTGYLEAVDRLYRVISGLLTSYELWGSPTMLSSVGDFVDRTATAHPKLTFAALSRLLMVASTANQQGQEMTSYIFARPFLMAIRTAVVRMELDYGNGTFIRPHFDAFEAKFSRIGN